MLLAERFVLLALDGDGTPARGTTNQDAVSVGVTGALVEELVLEGHVVLDRDRIALTGSRPAHPQLATTLDELGRFEGRKLRSRLGALRRSGWPEVVDGMVEAGIVGRQRTGLRPTRHPVADPVAHAVLLSDVRAAAVGDGPLDPVTATLLALAGPCQLLEVVSPLRSGRKHAKARIREATALVPVADAVRREVESRTTSATITASAT